MTPDVRAPRGGLALFWWVRARVWRRGLAALAREPVKLAVILSTWSALLAGIYALAYQGVRFVYDTAGLGPFLLSRLWFFFLFIVFLMLVVSQLVSAYSTLVRAPETRCWMALPVSARALCRAKWLESSAYNAWAVLLLALPLCLAYFVVLKRPLWLGGVLIGAALLPLLGIAASLSTLLLLAWLRWLSRLVIRKELVPAGLLLACGAFFWLIGERQDEAPSDIWFLALQGLLPRMQIAMAEWLPSRWAAAALDAMVHDRWTEFGRYVALLWTTALVCWRLLDHAAACLLVPVLQRHMQPLHERQAGSAGRLPAGFAVRWWMRRPLSAALVKDALLAGRDAMQWSQTVVFFGLLGVYFANIHRFAHFSGDPSWRIGIASLNLASTLLVFGSLAVRFVFPQTSLEGRALWLLRVAPGGTRRLLLAKFSLYGVLAAAIIEGLLWLSAGRLGVAPGIRWWLAGVGMVSALALVGLTVGLGAAWVDPSAQDAARVISSSSGALVLVLMLGYVGAVIAALVLGWADWSAGTAARLYGASAGLAVVSAVAGWVPMRRGLERLERLDGDR
jgi:hypothetical protein